MAYEELPKHAYLESVKVKGFRTLKDSEVTFVSGLNIIIGGNGVGKSNLLDIIFDCVSENHSRLSFENFNADVLFKEKRFSLEIAENQEILNELSNDAKVEILKHLKTDRYKEAYIFGSNNYTKDFATFLDFLQVKTTNYTIDIEKVVYDIPEKISLLGNKFNLPFKRKDSKITLDVFAIDDKTNFELFSQSINFLIVAVQDQGLQISKEQIEMCFEPLHESEILQRYTPIQDYRLKKDYYILNEGDQFVIKNLEIEFKINDNWFSWESLSDGTKRLFYLFLKVLNSSSSSVVLIEEPELGVHPHQFHSIMLFLKEQAQYKQIILTTHSPYALNVLGKDDLESIIIAKLDKDKGSVFKHLNEEQKAKALRYMTDVDYLSSYWMHSDLEDDEEED